MKTIDVRIEWSGRNYSCVTEDNALNGVILVTDKTLEGIKNAFPESLKFHIEGCIASGDNLPEWLVAGNYEVNYNIV
jgi:high-affinity K+ transport system ATPase subunit B